MWSVLLIKPYRQSPSQCREATVFGVIEKRCLHDPFAVFTFDYSWAWWTVVSWQIATQVKTELIHLLLLARADIRRALSDVPGHA